MRYTTRVCESAKAPAPFGMRSHARLSSPLTVAVFVLLAVPLALRVEQTHSMARSALIGVAVLFVFYLVREYGTTLASRGATPPTLTAWLLLLLFAGYGALQLYRTPR